ncbi:MAG: GH1 family beta-glucosidase [Pseudobdellovibrionaceae bacterium]|jgi:beta-glucosidase|nr:GH1 family beta-glucosidase [Pseudobdellovibrionaceae bacterium]
MTNIKFPADFIWGTATAAYQIEGGWNEGGKGESIWDRFSHTPGKIANGDTGDVACDHYHRWQEDFNLLQEYHIKNYRFSIAWTRIFPNGIGETNPEGIKFYNDLIDGLLERGITPWITMYHWDLPQALQEKGGWANRQIIAWFEEYAVKLIELFGDRVKNWMIINEPSVISYLGNAQGSFAPGIISEETYWKVVHHLNIANGHIYKVLKSRSQDLNIGTTYTPVPTRIHPSYPLDEKNKYLLEMWDKIWNGNFFSPALLGKYPDISAPYLKDIIQEGDMEICRCDFDFIGLQHYSPIYFRPNPDKVLGVDFSQGPDNVEVSDAGWEITPDAFYKCLVELQTTYGRKNWIITENGISLHDPKDDQGAVNDDRRINYLTRYLRAVRQAMDDGVNIGGYFIWSLLDNMEWASGYHLRFGIVHVDYQTLERTPKASMEWFRKVIDKNEILS